jgi:hypothetical protein
VFEKTYDTIATGKVGVPDDILSTRQKQNETLGTQGPRLMKKDTNPVTSMGAISLGVFDEQKGEFAEVMEEDYMDESKFEVSTYQ